VWAVWATTRASAPPPLSACLTRGARPFPTRAFAGWVIAIIVIIVLLPIAGAVACCFCCACCPCYRGTVILKDGGGSNVTVVNPSAGGPVMMQPALSMGYYQGPHQHQQLQKQQQQQASMGYPGTPQQQYQPQQQPQQFGHSGYHVVG
jgi:hypothetical protein